MNTSHYEWFVVLKWNFHKNGFSIIFVVWVYFFADVVGPDSNDHTSKTIPPVFSVDIQSIWENLRAAYVHAQPGFCANLDIWV